MKLKQKIAFLLTLILFISTLPLTINADSTNTLNKTLALTADVPITTQSALFLQVDYAPTDEDKAGGDVFFINSTDFEFDAQAYYEGIFDPTTPLNATVQYLSPSQLRITADHNIGDKIVSIPIVGTPKKGNPSITLDGEGGYATSGKYALSPTEVPSITLSVSTSDIPTLSTEGTGVIADIVLNEFIPNQLSNQTITIELPSRTDLTFSKTNEQSGTITLIGQRGLSNISQIPTSVSVINDTKIQITLPNTTSDARGSVYIQGIVIEPLSTESSVTPGNVHVLIKADKLQDTTLLIAKIVADPVTLHHQMNQVFTVNGNAKSISLWFEEHIVDAFPTNLTLSLDGGKWVSYNVLGEGFTYETNETTLKLTKTQAFSGLSLNMEIQATRSGTIKVIANSDTWTHPLILSVGEAFSNTSGGSSCTCSSSSTPIPQNSSLTYLFNNLSTQDQETIKSNLEFLPYTSLVTLSLNDLKLLTLNKLTDTQLKELSKLIAYEPLQLKPIATPFTDLENHWAKDSVDTLAKLGLVSGYQGYFMPNDLLKTTDTLTLLNRYLVMNSINQNKLCRTTVQRYNIVPNTHWSYNHVYNVCAKLDEGTVKQIENLDNSQINRGLLAQILMELTSNLNLTVTKSYTGFEDVKNTPYSDAIQYCYERGLLSGHNNLFRPNDSLSRAEMCVILTNLDHNLNH